MPLNLSPINVKYVEGKNPSSNNVENPVKTVENKKFDKKKLAFSAAAAAGVALLAGITIYKIAKGKSPTEIPVPSDDSSKINEFEKGVKKFFNNDGLVENVKLENGIAKNSDGSMFSGVMKTKNNKGENFTLEYLDGYIKTSSKDGKIFKQFENINNKQRSEACRITSFSEFGNPEKISEHYYIKDNGKTKIWQIYNSKERTLEEFSKEGKKIAEIKSMDINGSDIVHMEGEIYYPDGTLKRKITKTPNSQTEINYLKDDTKIKKGGFYQNARIGETVDKAKLQGITEVCENDSHYCAKESDMISDVLQLGDYAESGDYFGYRIAIPYSEKLSPKNDFTKNPRHVRLDFPVKNHATIGKEPLMIGSDGVTTRGSYTKEEILAMADELEKGFRTARQEGINFKNSDERFLDYIEQARQYAQTLD